MLQHALCNIFGAEPLVPLEGDVPFAEHNDNSMFKDVNVLVAEDTKTNRDILKLLLNPTGANVTYVTNGFDAVEAVRADAYDVVLMDVQMPRMKRVRCCHCNPAGTRHKRHADCRPYGRMP